MKKTLLAAGAVLALSSSFTANAAENDKPQYLSDWWHQSVNVVGSYHTRFSPKLNNDVYLEYEAFAKKDWFDFYGYIDIPKTFDWGNGNDKGIWSDAVSYTHLDVYKRQVLRLPLRKKAKNVVPSA